MARYCSKIANVFGIRKLHSEPEKTWQYIFDYNFG